MSLRDMIREVVREEIRSALREELGTAAPVALCFTEGLTPYYDDGRGEIFRFPSDEVFEAISDHGTTVRVQRQSAATAIGPARVFVIDPKPEGETRKGYPSMETAVRAAQRHYRITTGWSTKEMRSGRPK